jgi:Domain of unknown function (DUF3459)
VECLYFTDHVDPDLATAVSEGRRREFAAFGWQPEQVPDPQAPATFQASVLRWEELEDPAHGSMLQWYRDLLALRRHHGLAGAPVQVVEVTDGALTLRLGERGQLLVALNLGPGEHRPDLAWVSADLGCCELSVIMSAGYVTVGGAPAVGANRYRIAAPAEGQRAVPITLGVNAVAVFEIEPVEGTEL